MAIARSSLTLLHLFSSAPSADAGVEYKNTLMEDLKKDPRVESVEDVGVNEKTDKTGESWTA